MLSTIIHALHLLETFKEHLVTRVDSQAELMKANQDIQDELKKAHLEKEKLLKVVGASLQDLQE